MKTPIYDFVQKYACSDVLRLHMPGHKGKGENPSYALDITEIEGAGALYSESGIIAQSEKNASSLFGHPTFYSAEGSSQCIKAMLFLCRMYIDEMKPRRRGKMLVAAGRNAHSAFISAAALTDFDIMWIYPEKDEKNGANGFLSCRTAPADIERALVSCHKIPDALYITSPDYLGNIQDIGAISEICKKHGILLLVDNAHGAYLRFLPRSLHPMDLGADMCCDSAHKTLPVLTGGAYLHISRRLPESIEGCAKKALLLFGSTSPSYLILASLDHANLVLLEGFREKLARFVQLSGKVRKRLSDIGFTVVGDEPLKLTLMTKPYGYCGRELACLLRKERIECEFSDNDFVVLMLSPYTCEDELYRLADVLSSAPRKAFVKSAPPDIPHPERAMSVRQAVFSAWERVPVEKCLGRVVACGAISCPPAAAIAVSGEIIDQSTLDCLRYYGFTECDVVKAPE